MSLQVISFVRKQAEECMQKIGNKKIICYGASLNYQILATIVDIQEKVEFFVDRDSSKWGQVYHGREVKDPQTIIEVDREEYLVIVLVSAYEDVCKVLDNMGLGRGTDYITLVELLDGRNELVRYINAANKLLEFLDTVPKEMKERKVEKGVGRIGIVLSLEGQLIDPDFPYCVALFLILKWRGYNVSLIIDNLQWVGDVAYYKGFCDDCEKILSEIIRKLESIVPQEDIEYLDVYGKQELSEEDLQECKRVAEYSAVSQKWRKLTNFMKMPQETVAQHFEEAFRKNIGYVKAFFADNCYESVNISTALHRRAGIIFYICKKKGIRVSSQDGSKGGMHLSANGIVFRGEDISRTIKEQWCKDKEDEILQCAARMAQERFTKTNSSESDSFIQFQNEISRKGFAYASLQGGNCSTPEQYDVIIPLNCFADGSALGVHTIFQNWKQWLVETLNFVINELGRTVLLREHPLLKILPDTVYNDSDILSCEPGILEPYKNKGSLYYANFDEDINLYQYIKQCKVVLPWTSTVGLEAAVMRKNVVAHTDIYYADSTFAMRACSCEEYFSLIRKCLEEDDWLVKDKEAAHQDALKYFYYSMKRRLQTKLTLYDGDYHCITHAWMGGSFEELLQEKGVHEIMQIVAENVPSVYLAAQQQ